MEGAQEGVVEGPLEVAQALAAEPILQAATRPADALGLWPVMCLEATLQGLEALIAPPAVALGAHLPPERSDLGLKAEGAGELAAKGSTDGALGARSEGVDRPQEPVELARIGARPGGSAKARARGCQREGEAPQLPVGLDPEPEPSQLAEGLAGQELVGQLATSLGVGQQERVHEVLEVALGAWAEVGLLEDAEEGREALGVGASGPGQDLDRSVAPLLDLVPSLRRAEQELSQGLSPARGGLPALGGRADARVPERGRRKLRVGQSARGLEVGVEGGQVALHVDPWRTGGRLEPAQEVEPEGEGEARAAPQPTPDAGNRAQGTLAAGVPQEGSPATKPRPARGEGQRLGVLQEEL